MVCRRKKPIPLKKPLKEKIDPKQVLLNAKLQQELEDHGAVLFRPVEHGGSLNIDGEHLSLPSNITDVPGRVIGEYLNAFTQQKLYMRTLFGEMQCIVEECRRVYDNTRIGVYRELSSQKLSETAKDVIMNTDPSIQPSYERWVEAKLKLEMVKQSIENIADAIFLISREISRRESDFNHEYRNESVQKK